MQRDTRIEFLLEFANSSNHQGLRIPMWKIYSLRYCSHLNALYCPGGVGAFQCLCSSISSQRPHQHWPKFPCSWTHLLTTVLIHSPTRCWISSLLTPLVTSSSWFKVHDAQYTTWSLTLLPWSPLWSIWVLSLLIVIGVLLFPRKTKSFSNQLLQCCRHSTST